MSSDQESDHGALGRVTLRRLEISSHDSSSSITQTRDDETGSEYGFVRQRPRLIYLGSPENDFDQAGTSFSLSEMARIRFGRARSGSDSIVKGVEGDTLHIAVPLAWVSGVHAQMNIVAGERRIFQLADLKSSNGTMLEGTPIEGQTPVGTGQVFEIGRSFWMIRETAGSPPTGVSGLPGTETANPMFAALQRTLERLAESDLNVMLLGETGSGKAHAARSLHRRSGRAGPFVVVNLSSGPIERVSTDIRACVEQARGGTLYFEELGELDASAQARLLSLLTRITPKDGGATEGDEGTADVRIISASTRDLRHMVAENTFRPDLYSRLAAFEAEIPALRKRREDLSLLLRVIARDPEGKSISVSTGAFRRLLAYNWPFNVRELRHVLWAASRVSQDPSRIDANTLAKVMPRIDPRLTSPARVQAVRDVLVRRLIEHAGDTASVARSLSCDPKDVVSWLQRFEIAAEDYDGWR